MEKCLLQRVLEKVDQLSVSAGALTWLDRCLDDLLLLQGAQRPLSPHLCRIEKLVTEWPTAKPVLGTNGPTSENRNEVATEALLPGGL